jgi:hypothetical protein
MSREREHLILHPLSAVPLQWTLVHGFVFLDLLVNVLGAVSKWLQKKELQSIRI